MKKLAWVVAIALIAFGLAGQAGVPFDEYASTVSGWFQSGTTPPEVVVIDESGARPQAVAAIYLSKAVADVAARCKDYRWLDPDSSGPTKSKYQWAFDAAAKDGRCVVVRHGTRVAVHPMPATPDAMVDLLRKNGAT